MCIRDSSFTAITRDTNIIAQVVAGNSGVIGCFSADQIATITEFGQHMDFFGIDLTRVPQYNLCLLYTSTPAFRKLSSRRRFSSVSKL